MFLYIRNSHKITQIRSFRKTKDKRQKTKDKRQKTKDKRQKDVTVTLLASNDPLYLAFRCL